MLSEAAENFAFSYSSRAKPLTTRMPRTFSSTDSFIRSYLWKTARKAGIAFLAISTRPRISAGTTTTKVSDSVPPMRQAMTMAKTNISGARTAMRMAIMKAICTLVISVVIRVTREAVEKRSMFSKEKRWIRSNTSRRTLRAKPAEARAPKKPAPPPQARDSTAITTRIRPRRTTSFMGTPALMSLTRSAV